MALPRVRPDDDPTLSNCAVCRRSAPDGPAVDPALVASIGAMKARSDVKANEIQGGWPTRRCLRRSGMIGP